MRTSSSSAAALRACRRRWRPGPTGRSVLVIDANSVGGGHAVKAGGFALVGTPLQEKKGYRDSPEIAERDLLAWGEDADPEWVRRYVRASRTEVHDWLTAFGVRWGFILDTPEHSVPRFHFANGSALNVVVPLMRAAYAQPNLEFRWNTEAVTLHPARTAPSAACACGTCARASPSDLRAPAVIVATGGWQSDLDFVRGELAPGPAGARRGCTRAPATSPWAPASGSARTPARRPRAWTTR